MEQVTDKLETLILLSLDARSERIGTIASRDHRSGAKIGGIDPGEALKIGNMSPQSSYTVDMVDEDRLIATRTAGLLTHPADTFGDEAEVTLMFDCGLRWFGYRRLTTPPRGVSCAGRAAVWYEMHSRHVGYDGTDIYQKRVVPLDRRGAPLPAMFEGCCICSPQEQGRLVIGSASIIEDAHRANAMLAAVKDATEIKFPVPLGDYKDVFSDRDGPMHGTRKKSIVHWVAKHIRHSTRGNEYEVKRHTRGVQEFNIDGLRIRLSPNAGGKPTARQGRSACPNCWAADARKGLK